MNEYARNNRYLASAKELRHHIRHFLNVTLPDIADRINSRIYDNFQMLIKPASSSDIDIYYIYFLNRRDARPIITSAKIVSVDGSGTFA